MMLCPAQSAALATEHYTEWPKLTKCPVHAETLIFAGSFQLSWETPKIFCPGSQEASKEREAHDEGHAAKEEEPSVRGRLKKRLTESTGKSGGVSASRIVPF